MVLSQRGNTSRKPTGGRYRTKRSKRLLDSGSHPALTQIAPKKTESKRTIGGGKKLALLATETVTLLDTKSGKRSTAKITHVVENAANRHFVRRNILTKGALIETDKGKAKVTNRPGQDGVIHAMLV